MTTVEKILSNERSIINEAENSWINEDEYYLSLKESGSQWAYKYGRVTFNLANQIRELQPGIFNGLQSLQILYLYHNQISELQPNIFNGLQSLRVLELQTNQISVPAGTIVLLICSSIIFIFAIFVKIFNTIWF